MKINRNDDRRGLYESPYVEVCTQECEGVLCQSDGEDGSVSDDLLPGSSWEDKIWKD
jgi:hypothetical protein